MEEKAPDTAGAKPSIRRMGGKSKTPTAILGEVGTPTGGVYPNEVGGGGVLDKKTGGGGSFGKWGVVCVNQSVGGGRWNQIRIWGGGGRRMGVCGIILLRHATRHLLK